MSAKATMERVSSAIPELEIAKKERLTLIQENQRDGTDDFARDVQKGLSTRQKYLLPKYLYDKRGSELFVEITQTKEYYPTRTEKAIINHIAPQFAERFSHINVLVELGSGSAEKTEVLIDEFHRRNGHFTYVPVDVSDILVDSSRELLNKYEHLHITGIISSYDRGLSIVKQINDKKVILFLGSSIGNMGPKEVEDFLQQMRAALESDDYVMIGFDLLKDHQVLRAAYNDSSGVTRDFNKNILRRINAELDGNFNPEHFEHQAVFNEEESRMEMHLVSNKQQKVFLKSLNQTIDFKRGESIHTENSYKFTLVKIRSLMKSAGFQLIESWTDPKNYYALCLFQSR